MRTRRSFANLRASTVSPSKNTATSPKLSRPVSESKSKSNANIAHLFPPTRSSITSNKSANTESTTSSRIPSPIKIDVRSRLTHRSYSGSVKSGSSGSSTPTTSNNFVNKLGSDKTTENLALPLDDLSSLKTVFGSLEEQTHTTGFDGQYVDNSPLKDKEPLLISPKDTHQHQDTNEEFFSDSDDAPDETKDVLHELNERDGANDTRAPFLESMKSTRIPTSIPSPTRSIQTTSTPSFSINSTSKLNLNATPDLTTEVLHSKTNITTRSATESIIHRPPTSLSNKLPPRAITERAFSSLGRPESRLFRQVSPDKEASVLTKEIEDLKIKLQAMEQKRKEDQAKLSSETHLRNVVKKLENKLAHMHQELKLLNAKLLNLENENLMLTESVLEKEESYESVMIEFEILKERYGELETECDVLREENELYTDLDENEVVKKNVQLQSALLKFRDLMSEQDEKIKKYESNEIISDSFREAQDQLKEAEEVIQDLRVQLDNALGSEEMIEDLTDKNLQLEEKIEELEETINELEELKTLNDELEQNHLLTEKQLIAEVDELEELNNTNQQKLIQSEERNTYLESAIRKFKEVVTILESDLAELRKSNEDSEALKQHNKEIVELNKKLSSTASEASSKAMDLELGKFEAQQALVQLEIVKCYLEESYKEDEASIEGLLRLDRIEFKSELLQTFLLEREDLLEYMSVLMTLLEIQRYSSGLSYYAKCSSVDEFPNCAIYFAQMTAVDTALSGLIDNMKSDSLQEQTFSQDLELALQKVYLVFRNFVSNTDKELQDPYHLFGVNDLNTIQLSSRLISEIYSQLKNIIVGSDDSGESEVMTGLSEYATSLVRLKVLVPRIIEELDALYAQSKILSVEEYEKLSKVSESCKLLVQYFMKVYKTLSSEMYESSTFDVFKSEYQTVFEFQDQDKNLMASLGDKLSEILTYIRTFKVIDTRDIVKPIPPWFQKASEQAKAQADNATKQEEIESLRLEIQRLATTVRSRDKAIEEHQVKYSLLTSKMVKSKEQALKINEVKKALAESLAEEKQLKETISELRGVLEEQQKKIDKYGRKSSLRLTESGVSFEALMISGMQSEIQSLKEAVRYLSSGIKKVQIVDDTFLDDITFGKPLTPIFSESENKLRSTVNLMYRGLRTDVDKLELVKISEATSKEKIPFHSINRARLRALQQRESLEKLNVFVTKIVK